ncbi:MAG TPA: hypothetical protein VK184_27530 [Nostocaceae cyanobacterium]|nr:hypothetical protein [Nostocaceae cyanobacterium]
MTNISPLFDVDQLIAENKRRKAQEHLPHNTRKMMRFMLETGLDKDVIAALLQMVEFDSELICYFAGPIITYKCAWTDTIPQWLFQAIILDRFDQILEENETGGKTNLATPSEVTAYLMPASMEHPIGTRWTDVYLWASNATLVKHNRVPQGHSNCWEFLGRPVDYRTIKHDYEMLARDIRASSVKAAKERGWYKSRNDKSLHQVDVNQPETLEEETEEITQFDLLSIPQQAAEPEFNCGVKLIPAMTQTSLFG